MDQQKANRRFSVDSNQNYRWRETKDFGKRERQIRFELPTMVNAWTWNDMERKYNCGVFISEAGC